MRFISLYILMVLIFSSSAQAREEFWYMGMGAGTTFLEDRDNAFTSINNKGKTAKIYMGYRVSQYLAFEVDYAYLGRYDYVLRDVIVGEAVYQAPSFSILVMYPMGWDELELITPVGVSFVNSDYGPKSGMLLGPRLGFGVAYTPTKHFTMRLTADVTVFEFEAVGEKFTQNLVGTYFTLQYNF
ncbi:outer membrane beta-barrel protein [Sulfurimonas sp. MAG313]|nr:outer membrane beta-barrel protein [Sulfurimonas sp. MAG313]MDF1881919.1 outer membrane beta-barrel protein [Sulfurimonas sp. MAG313]